MNISAKRHDFITLMLALLIGLPATSCNTGLDLTNISSEVTIGTDGLVIPLGFLEEKKLSDIISTDDIENLTIDANGNYRYFIDGDGKVDIDGMDASFELEGITKHFNINYPSSILTDNAFRINDTYTVNVPSELAGLTTIPAGTNLGNLSISCSGTTTLDYEVTLPSYVSSVKKIYLGGTQYGVQLNLSFNLNGLASINGGGDITIGVTAPEGYVLCDKTGRETGNTLTYTEHVASGAAKYSVTAYIKSIDTSNKELHNHLLVISDRLSYTLNYTFTPLTGRTFSPTSTPTFAVAADMAFKDAEVGVVDLEIDNQTHNLTQRVTISDIAEEIVSVERVTLTNSTLTLRLNGLEWIDDSICEIVPITITLPKEFVIKESSDFTYNATNHSITTDLKALNKGLKVELAEIALSAEQQDLSSHELVIDAQISVYIEKIPSSESIMIASLLRTSPGTVVADFLLDDTTITIDSVKGTFNYISTEEGTSIKLDFDKLDALKIDDLGVCPIVRLMVENPIGVELVSDIIITPYKDNVAISENILKFNNITIAKALSKEQKGITKIAIAKAESREEIGPDETFVEGDFTKILKGTMPDEIKIAFHIVADNKPCTIYILDNYAVNYDYSIDIPLALSEATNISYSDTVEDLSDVFADIAIDDVLANRVNIGVIVKNSTPLEFTIDADLLDSDGNLCQDVKGSVDTEHNVIAGSADSTIKESTVIVAIEITDSNVSSLKEIDKVRFTLKLNGVKDNASLNKDQILSLKAVLTVGDGVTIDWKNFL